MRSVPILDLSTYHVYNRGNQKQTLFFDQQDYARFLFLILYFQSPEVFTQINRNVSKFVTKQSFGVKKDDEEEVVKRRVVTLQNFCIMPNHFHLTVFNNSETGLEKYMHRISNGYAKYFNTKYERTGHVFQGTYKAVLIDSDKQHVYTSAYIHKNSEEITEWQGRADSYIWSSYQDYIRENRWGELLDISTIRDTFSSSQEYRTYVELSGAKEEI